jgi:hypothetical protein
MGRRGLGEDRLISHLLRRCLVEALLAAQGCEAIHEKELRFDLGTARLA